MIRLQNLLREDKALILVPSDSKSGLLQSLDMSSRPDGRSIAYSCGCLYKKDIWYCFYHLRCLRNGYHGLSALIGCWSSIFIRVLFTNC